MVETRDPPLQAILFCKTQKSPCFLKRLKYKPRTRGPPSCVPALFGVHGCYTDGSASLQLSALSLSGTCICEASVSIALQQLSPSPGAGVPYHITVAAHARGSLHGALVPQDA